MTKTLAILGGAGAIGRALTLNAISNDWNVIVLDLESTIEKYPVPNGVEYKYIDLFDDNLLQETFRSIVPLQGFVNTAGFTTSMQKIVDLDFEDITEVITGNLIGAFKASKLAMPKLTEGKGALVNVASGLASFSRPKFGPYAAAKAGLISMTKTLALEAAPLVRVNAVSPSAVDTDFIHGGAGRAQIKPLDLDFERIASNTPLKRVATPEDIVGPILFLLEGASSYMTGQVLWVNGGSYMP
tara:strand:- start:2829 stop:3554 length:726 start_codon:yes stop_codon:yes gene_type:complete